MTASSQPTTVPPNAPTTPPSTTSSSRLLGAARMVFDGVLVQRVAEGRLRNVGWPKGWGAVIGVGYVGFAFTALLVLTSSWWRQGRLVPTGDGVLLIPQSTVWVLAWLMMTVAALLHLGAMRGPWWSKTASLVIVTVLLALWPAMVISVSSILLAVPGIVCVLIMIVFSLVRIAAKPRWWEFCVYWVLLTVPVIFTMMAVAQASRPLGFELVPPLIAQTIGLLALLCLPVAVASGTAVAELTVSATVWVALAAGRLSRRPVLVALLIVAFVARGVQTVVDLRSFDLFGAGVAQSVLPVVGCALLLAGVSIVLIRRAGPVPSKVTELPDDLTRIAIPIGIVLVGVLVPFSLLLFGVQLAFSVSGVGELGGWTSALSSEGPAAIIRALVALALLVLAVRAADRRRISIALLEAHIAIFLLPAPIGLLTQASFPLLPDPDLLNVLVTLLAGALLIGCLATRGLTNQRIAGLGAMVVLGAVFSGRDVLLTPLSWAFGPSAALILVGLVWTLMTGCDRANVAGRGFSATSRSAMMMGFVLLTGLVLAYYTLAGTPSQGPLDVASTLGDAILGTALLTGTVTILVVQISGRTSIS